MITKEQFNEAYSKASPAQQYLCSESGGALLEIAKKYSLDKEAYKNFAITIGAVVLNFSPKTDLPKLLVSEVGLDEITALKMTGDLLDFLEPLTDPNWQPPPESVYDEDFSDEVLPTVQEEIAETEATLKSLRTMADDQVAAKDETYPSLQDDILGQKNNSKPADSPRWESGS